MSEIYLDLKEKLNQWQPVIATSNDQKVEWQLPTELEHGLFTTNIAFLLAKSLKQNPNQIAQDLKLELDKFLDANQLPLESVQVGPYLNLKLKESFFVDLITSDTLSLPAQNSLKKEEKTVLLDYVGANVAKRLHVGHMRNLNIGESLHRLLELKYSTVITDNHWGDWGVQFGVLLWGWKVIFKEDYIKDYEKISFDHTKPDRMQLEIEYKINPIETLQKIYVWTNTQEKVIENWKEYVRQEFYYLEFYEPNKNYVKLGMSESDQIRYQTEGEYNKSKWEEFTQKSKQSLKADLELFKVPNHDIEQGESFYSSDIKHLSEFMEENKIWKTENNARFFDFEELAESWAKLPDDEKPDETKLKEVSKFGRAYLFSSDLYSTYCYRDIAARWQWARDYQADLMISVVDKTQKHNFDQAFSIICYLASRADFKDLNEQYDGHINISANDKFSKPMNAEATISRLKFENLVHVGYGFLSLPEGKMSTRKGTVIILKDLVNQVQEAAKENLKSKNVKINDQDLEKRSKVIAIAALKWFDLNRDSWADIVLDIPQILQFEGNTGVYQLYTYARLKSILRKNENEKILKQVQDDKSYVLGDLKSSRNEILNTTEKLIIQQMYTLPETLEKAVTSYKPHLVCNHLYSLCDKINSWYNSTSILKEENQYRKELLIDLIKDMTNHIEFALRLLAIEVLEEI